MMDGGHATHAAHAVDAVVGAGELAIWTAIVLAGVAYLAAATRRPGWPALRTASFMGGASVLLAAFLPPVTAWAHADLRGHMLQHLLIGMVAPLLLVLASPVGLLLGALPVPVARRVAALLHSAPVRVVSHPVSALLLNVGGMALLYSTPLYALSRGQPALHALVHYHFLAAGYLFCWSIAGPDPAPRRPSLRLRGAVLLAGIAGHALLAKWMYIHLWPAGTGAAPAEIRAAAQWMYYGGDLAELGLVIAYMAVWYRRTAPRRMTGCPDAAGVLAPRHG